jgi:alpha-tubulin suppressor-like RCC1 family protein
LNEYGASVCDYDKTFKSTAISTFQYVNDKLPQRDDQKHDKIEIKVTSNGLYSKHTFLVDSNDAIYAFGCNLFGQFGSGTFDKMKRSENLSKINNHLPLKIDNSFCQNVSIKRIECGADHTLFLLKNGKVFGCGSNKLGQCGLEKKEKEENILRPTQIALDDDFVVDIQC